MKEASSSSIVPMPEASLSRSSIKPNNPRDKESIRTSFQLSHQAYQAKIWLAEFFKETQKDTVDRVCLSLMPDEPDNDLLPLEAIEACSKAKRERHKRTHVITRRALRVIESFSKNHGFTRDDVLEGAILEFETMIRNVLDGRSQKHQKALGMLNEYWGQAERFEKELIDLLGSDDPIVYRFGVVPSVLNNLCNAIDNELENGIPINPDEY